MKKNVAKKLNNVYFKNVNKHSLKKIIKKLEEVISLRYDQPKEDIIEEFIKNYSDIKSQKGDEIVMSFNTCSCDNFEGSYFILDILKIDDISSCDEKKEVDLKHFMYFEKSNTFKELMNIKYMPDYKDIDSKITAIKKFRNNLNEKLKDYDELNKISKIIYNACYTNKYILDYNMKVSEMFSQHKYGENIKKLLLKFTGCEHLGYIEMDDADNYEMMIHLHLDTCDIYNNSILYEGYAIFADIGINKLTIVNNNEIKYLAKKIETAISRSSTIESIYEITTNFENESYQYFISVDEFKTTLDRQLFNLKKNADDIFTSLFKLLYLIDINQTYEGIVYEC